MKRIILLVLGLSMMGFMVYYPVDGYERTGIKRLKRLELIKSGELKDAATLPVGAMKNWNEIELNLVTRKEDSTASFFCGR